MSKSINRIGQSFDRLTVMAHAGKDKRNRTLWKCQCICGNIVIVNNSNLTNKSTKSCGCLNKEKTIERNFVHGMYYTPEYNIWSHIIQRCTNPKNARFEDYGGRGITVCTQWHNSFTVFFNDMGKRPTPKHTIERMNNNKGYSPKNCIWATRQAQSNNKRNNYNITLYGWTMNIAQWTKFIGKKRGIIASRLRRKWPIAKAIFCPIQKHKFILIK